MTKCRIVKLQKSQLQIERIEEYRKQNAAHTTQNAEHTISEYRISGYRLRELWSTELQIYRTTDFSDYKITELTKLLN